MAFKGSRQRHKGQPLFKHRPLWTERTVHFTVWYNPSTALTGICLCAYSGSFCFGSLSHSLRHVQHDSMVPTRTVAAEAALLAWIAVHYVICRSTLVYSFLSPYNTELRQGEGKRIALHIQNLIEKPFEMLHRTRLMFSFGRGTG